MAVTVTPGFFGLNWKDLIQGALIAALSTPLTLIVDSLDKGSFNIDWKHLGVFAATTFASYILKKLLSVSQVRITGLDGETLQAIKDGAKVVAIKEDTKVA